MLTFSFVYSALRLWVSFLCSFCLWLSSFHDSQPLISICIPLYYLYYIIMFDLQFCAFSSVTSSFLCLLDALRLNLSPRKKIVLGFTCSCTSGSFTFVSLSSSANQSNYVCLYLSVNFKKCFPSLWVTLVFWECYLCPSS